MARDNVSRLDAGLIERNLGTGRVGRAVLCFEQVDSTNDVAWDSARQTGERGDCDGLVILAESQRRGRGRGGRKWLSRPGLNILMSVLLIDRGGSMSAEAVTIAAGLAVAEAVEQVVDLRAELKWPNDVLLEEAKVAGVLVETRDLGGAGGLVVGIGLNAGSCPSAEEVDTPATSLREHLGFDPDRVELIRAILRRLDRWAAAISAGLLDELHSAWLPYCGMLNQRVAVLSGGRRHVGRVIDVDPLRGLELLDDHGTRFHIPAAGASILHDAPGDAKERQ